MSKKSEFAPMSGRILVGDKIKLQEKKRHPYCNVYGPHLDVVRVPALWTEYGKAAGMRRNHIIAALPIKYLLAFPGGVGTAGMIRIAQERREVCEVIEVR